VRPDRLWTVLIQNLQRDRRSVRLGLSMDGFTPYINNSTSYSCWPVFMMSYNLPPNKCMKERVMFLFLIVPSPKDLVTKINVFIQPLIKELKVMWQGIEAYDSHLKRSFTLRPTYLWSIHDLLAYVIFSGWCVHGPRQETWARVVGHIRVSTTSYADTLNPDVRASE
jgi:hypothetical protein